jgi:hypothetical protein
MDETAKAPWPFDDDDPPTTIGDFIARVRAEERLRLAQAAAAELLVTARITEINAAAAVDREDRRRAGKDRDNQQRGACKEAKRAMARELWAEFQGDLQRRTAAVIHREIGEIIMQRLDLSHPVPAETVRKYLAS